MDNLEKITAKIHTGQRLSREDGFVLLRSGDILSMAKLARAVKNKKTGKRIFFNVNCHINLTNICISRCCFCAFSCDPKDPGAYCMTAEEAAERVRAALPAGITEVHMVSGLHPDLPFAYYVDVVRQIKNDFPAVHVKAFTPVEIKYFSDIAGMSTENVLICLKEAGLESLPGGGAEVLSSRVRQQLCPNKASAVEWLEVMKTAHRLGLRSNATLLFGHMETGEEIIDHLLSLRRLQDDTGGFQTFIPLPFHPHNTRMDSFQKPSAYEILKMFYVSRLMLDNFEHIKAYWIMTGLKTAQLSLYFGVDDVDGTVTEEKITHAAGADTAVGVAKKELINMIKQTGYTPVQRDTLYNVVETY
jgi:aminodeoxyfutalosine synthase